ncbi:MAG: glycosyltransferase [Lachnospiraceae bacterium]|nr:glycosyltransferase [Lachnospiraceae bacterium]
MKKKVLIIMPSMFIGGAERSLLGLLDAFDYNVYDVSLFLYRHEGDFLPFINEHVRILPAMPEYETFDVPIKALLRSSKFKYGLLRLFAKVKQRLHSKKKPDETGVWMHMQKISQSLQKSLPEIPGKYDLGIMFLGVADTLVNKVDAKVKLAWNHTDYTTLHPDKTYDRKIFRELDYVVSVSEESKKQFLNVYPELQDKAIVIENILSPELIRKQSEEESIGMRRNEGETILLSVGRYSYAKNFDNVPDICRRIVESGVPVKWYIIGYGGDEAIIKQKIEENDMQAHVILLGKKTNPYPYIKNCDIYVQPSRFEGKCVTVREAQILHKPVVITNYASSKSQLDDGVDGVIVPLDNKQCAEGISAFIVNADHQGKVIRGTYDKDYSNKAEVEKIVSVLENCGF